MPIPKATMTLLAEVLDERAKQIAKGFTAEVDDAWQKGELAQAAASLALSSICLHADELHLPRPLGHPGYMSIPAWPLMDANLDPGKPARAAYLAAASLLIAEVERLDRMRDAGEIEYCGSCGALVWKDEAVVDVEGVVLCPECAAGSEVAYANEPDPVARFLRERCDRNPEASETVADLYAAYEDWASLDPTFRMTCVVFSRNLQALPWIMKVQAFGAAHFKGVHLRRER
ncbi:MAG: hypothetical protein AB7D37_05550 [Desulfovibrio sp.]